MQQAIKDDIGDDSTNEASEGEEYSETTVEEIPVKAPSQKRRKKRKSLLQGQEVTLWVKLPFLLPRILNATMQR